MFAQAAPINATPRKTSLIAWVPSTYITMGFPNAVVSGAAVVMFKNLGLSVVEIALYTSQLYLPWVLKPLWAPILEAFAAKRSWVISMQLLIATALGGIAASLTIPDPLILALAFLWIVGFASATHDVAVDGVFMAATSPRQQAKYAGFQGMCWNIGSVLASGVLVTTSGWLHGVFFLSWVHSWMIMMCLSAVMVSLVALYHARTLPDEVHAAVNHLPPRRQITEAWSSFAAKDKIVPMLIVVFLYRIGEAFIDKIGPLFLLDSRSGGGLGLTNQTHGLLYGTLGTIAFISGTFVASALVTKMTLRRTFFALTIAMNVPHITYALLSTFHINTIEVIAFAVCIEKFGFGMGSVGQLLYMVQQVAPGRYRMTHYAFATAIMASTHWVAGSLSGIVFSMCNRNYAYFFNAVLAISMVPIAVGRFAPFPVKDAHPLDSD